MRLYGEIAAAILITLWRFLRRVLRAMVTDPLETPRGQILVKYFDRDHL